MVPNKLIDWLIVWLNRGRIRTLRSWTWVSLSWSATHTSTTYQSTLFRAPSTCRPMSTTTVS